MCYKTSERERERETKALALLGSEINAPRVNFFHHIFSVTPQGIATSEQTTESV
jgi:hypothetical protein